MGKKIVIFDNDGVNVNSFELHYQITALKIPGLTRQEYRDMFKENIIKALTERQMLPPEFDPNSEFQKRLGLVKEFPGMRETLQALNHKFDLTINSSSHSDRIRTVLDQFDLTKYFKTILGGEIEPSKSKKLLNLLSMYGNELSEGIFITDTAGDAWEAKQVGMDTVGVTWGFHSERYFREVKPKYICTSPRELKELLFSL